MSRFQLNPLHDKVMTGYFRAFYDDLLGSRDVRSVLEIGVRYGESMLLWRSGFPQAKVYGVDIIPKPAEIVGDPRLVYIEMNAYIDHALFVLSHERPGGFDLVIDDGPHTLPEQRFFLDHYAGLVAPGGVLVLEDIMDVAALPELESHLDHLAFHVQPIVVPPALMDEPFRSQFKDGLGVIVAERRPE